MVQKLTLTKKANFDKKKDIWAWTAFFSFQTQFSDFPLNLVIEIETQSQTAHTSFLEVRSIQPGDVLANRLINNITFHFSYFDWPIYLKLYRSVGSSQQLCAYTEV